MASIDDFIHQPSVGYFSMEIALRNEIPTYAGGLGVLAGDTLRSAADLEIPVVAVTLASTMGYFRQTIDAEGRQAEQIDPWDPSKWAVPPEGVSITLLTNHQPGGGELPTRCPPYLRCR